MKNDNEFYNLETIGGILLFFSAIVAMGLANSPLSGWYQSLFETPVEFRFGTFSLDKPLLLWVNDGLMAMYFLLVGLEIKREIKRGVLSSKTSISVPAITALCGLLVPAAIFYSFTYHDSTFVRGWAIPTATDIAFTLGILSILGSRVPISLKILLTAIAIFDDIAAIVIIAIFYTKHMSILSLSMAFIFTSVLFSLNYFGVKRVSIFMIVGIALWIAVLKSGVHATLAGIVIAMAIPDQNNTNTNTNTNTSMLTKLEDGLHPWIVFLILPAFALANAGVSFKGINLEILLHPIVLGVSLGLILGKQIGVFLPLWYFVKKKKFLKSDKINLLQVYGLALICGVGFTMSLFIGSLAYQGDSSALMNMVKLGVVFGSFISGFLGYCVLRISCNNTL
jgi:NhaA family Na+:H+ antiporter